MNELNDSAIKLSDGINDQYLITINSTNSDMINNCGESFGYAIKQGEINLVKLLGMKEKGDENG